jgi:error-prone DNA polymerase
VPILNARKSGGTYSSIPDLARRSGQTKAVLSRLAAADALSSLNVERRAALWDVLALHDELPLFQNLDAEEPAATLEETPIDEHITQDYETTGLSLKAHPLGLLRKELESARVITCASLPDIKPGAFVRIAGLVLVKQRPETASGVIFMTIEDETGNANLIIWPKVYEEHRKVARLSTALIVEGHVQREGAVIHVIAKRLFDLNEDLPDLQWKSRDFR